MNNEEIKENLSEMLFNRDERLLDVITNLQEKLEVSKTNEETYRLEMLDITKCLGLDENTIFDEVKEKATNLQEENERLKMDIRYWEDKWQYTKFSDKDYKSRIDKAKEFIEHENFKRTLLGFSENKYLKNIQKELLNILGGDE